MFNGHLRDRLLIDARSPSYVRSVSVERRTPLTVSVRRLCAQSFFFTWFGGLDPHLPLQISGSPRSRRRLQHFYLAFSSIELHNTMPADGMSPNFAVGKFATTNTSRRAHSPCRSPAARRRSARPSSRPNRSPPQSISRTRGG